MSGVLAYIISPWSVNDEGSPEKIAVLVDDLDNVPEMLGRAIAAEARFQRRTCDNVTMKGILATYQVRALEG